MRDTSNIDNSCYTMRFGKFKGMKAKDIAHIITLDKFGKKKPSGLEYLKFITTMEWFKHKEIIEDVINQYNDEINNSCVANNDDTTTEQIKQEEVKIEKN